MTELVDLSVTELSAAYEAGDTDPVEATRAALELAETIGPQVNAMVRIDAQTALAEAADSARRWRSGRPRGRADGVPTTIKDIFWTRGVPTLRGSRLVDETGPWVEDAPATARLREAGVALIGKTTTPEFAWKGVTDSARHGPTGNPWDPTRTAGGSSGGSAAAVALGIGAWSVGTDGGGSVRIPAAFTGTVALKPTYGLIPLHPASPFGTLAHAGPMTRRVADAALMLDLLAVYDPRDWSAMPTASSSYFENLATARRDDRPLRGVRVAFSPDLGFADVDGEVARLVRAAVDVLVELGAEVDEVNPGFDDPVDAFDVLWSSGAAKVVEAYGVTALDVLDPGLRRCVERGRTRSASDYLDAVAVRMDLGRRMGDLHREYDVLVTPTVPITAFALGADVPPTWDAAEWTSWTPFTYPFNLTQQPALSVPCGLSADGLPVGLQIVGARFGDATVLRVGDAYERATPWHRQRPPLARRDGRPGDTPTDAGTAPARRTT